MVKENNIVKESKEFLKERSNVYKIACELCYPDWIKDRIRRAKTEGELYRLLKEGRESV